MYWLADTLRQVARIPYPLGMGNVKNIQEISTMNKTAIQFDNHDSRIKYYELLLERDLENLPYFPLPKGYKYV